MAFHRTGADGDGSQPSRPLGVAPDPQDPLPRTNGLIPLEETACPCPAAAGPPLARLEAALPPPAPKGVSGTSPQQPANTGIPPSPTGHQGGTSETSADPFPAAEPPGFPLGAASRAETRPFLLWCPLGDPWGFVGCSSMQGRGGSESPLLLRPCRPSRQGLSFDSAPKKLPSFSDDSRPASPVGLLWINSGCLRSRYCRPLRHSVPSIECLYRYDGTRINARHGAPKGRPALRRRAA